MSLTKLSSSGFEEKSGFSARTYRKQGKVSMNYHSILKGKKTLVTDKTVVCEWGWQRGSGGEKRSFGKIHEKKKKKKPSRDG